MILRNWFNTHLTTLFKIMSWLHSCWPPATSASISPLTVESRVLSDGQCLQATSLSASDVIYKLKYIHTIITLGTGNKKSYFNMSYQWMRPSYKNKNKRSRNFMWHFPIKRVDNCLMNMHRYVSGRNHLGGYYVIIISHVYWVPTMYRSVWTA